MVIRRPGGAATRPMSHFRAWPRRAVALPASVLDLDRGVSFTGQTVDLSVGGARVDFAGPEPGMLPETSVELVLSPPMRWDPLRVRGKIAWRGAPGVYGLRFEHASPSGLMALWEVLQTPA